MTATPETLPLSDAQVIDEYHRLCREYGYSSGVCIRVLLDHDYRQGAQLFELTPDRAEREHLADRHSFLKGAHS